MASFRVLEEEVIFEADNAFSRPGRRRQASCRRRRDERTHGAWGRTQDRVALQLAKARRGINFRGTKGWSRVPVAVTAPKHTAKPRRSKWEPNCYCCLRGAQYDEAVVKHAADGDEEGSSSWLRGHRRRRRAVYSTTRRAPRTKSDTWTVHTTSGMTMTFTTRPRQAPPVLTLPSGRVFSFGALG